MYECQVFITVQTKLLYIIVQMHYCLPVKLKGTKKKSIMKHHSGYKICVTTTKFPETEQKSWKVHVFPNKKACHQSPGWKIINYMYKYSLKKSDLNKLCGMGWAHNNFKTSHMCPHTAAQLYIPFSVQQDSINAMNNKCALHINRKILLINALSVAST